MKTDELIQWLAMQDLNKTLPSLQESAPTTRTLAAISYFALTGGMASEYNILHLIRYCGLDTNNTRHMDAARDMLAFYSAAGIIDVIDNNLGIEQMINDPSQDFYRKGLVADTTEHGKKLSEMKNELLERADFGREEDGR